MSEHTVPAPTLLRGLWFALEQAGLLLNHAVLLYDGGACPTAAGVALLAREELGRHAILQDLWAKAATGAPAPTRSQLRALCEDHVQKQRRGMFSSSLRGEGESAWARLLRSLHTLPYHSREAAAVRDNVNLARLAKDKRTPDERHATRMRAFYVDLHDDANEWSRPTDLDPVLARDTLYDAVNDYSVRRDNLTTPGVREFVNADLARALDAWGTKPSLPPPKWPRVLDQPAGE